MDKLKRVLNGNDTSQEEEAGIMPYVSTTLVYKYALYDVFISHFCGFVTRRFLFVCCV